MKLHRQYKISGKVQGVFFRASTKSMADELGILGWVRNELDGTVFIKAEAEAELLESFEKWLKQGPQFSRVDEIKIKEDKVENFSEFNIQH